MIDQIRNLGDVPVSEKAEIISSKTLRPIPLQELENLLDIEQLAWRDEITSQWSGPLVVAMDEGSEVSEGLAELFRHLNKIRSVHIETDKPEWAVKCRRLLDALVALGNITQEQSDKVVALGGSRRYGDVTEEQVANEIAQQELRDLQQQRADEFLGLIAIIQNDFIAPAISGSETLEEVKARIKQEL